MFDFETAKAPPVPIPSDATYQRWRPRLEAAFNNPGTWHRTPHKNPDGVLYLWQRLARFGFEFAFVPVGLSASGVRSFAYWRYVGGRPDTAPPDFTTATLATWEPQT